MEIKLEISKKAGLLKKPVRFTDMPAQTDVEIKPNPELWTQYIDTNPVHRAIQCSGQMSEHEVRTFFRAGCNHYRNMFRLFGLR